MFSLPDFVKIGGTEYEVFTDFRDWIKFELLISDDDVSYEEKTELIFDWYIDELPPFCKESIDALFKFYLCGKEFTEDNGGENEQFLCFEQDAALIYAAFMQTYKINLLTIKYLHWWEFKALFDGLPEDTRLMKVIGYRTVDTSKMDAEDKKRYEKLKEIYALDKNRKRKPKTLIEHNERILAKLRESNQKAHE
ncbi:hypothetical protein AGMMS49975_22570 [Clostridia bacterium]|nr:hypothetical protein AGMMS49975_22570 [Clostridia bacterium]